MRSTFSVRDVVPSIFSHITLTSFSLELCRSIAGPVLWLNMSRYAIESDIYLYHHSLAHTLVIYTRRRILCQLSVQTFCNPSLWVFDSVTASLIDDYFAPLFLVPAPSLRSQLHSILGNIFTRNMINTIDTNILARILHIRAKNISILSRHNGLLVCTPTFTNQYIPLRTKVQT